MLWGSVTNYEDSIHLKIGIWLVNRSNSPSLKVKFFFKKQLLDIFCCFLINALDQIDNIVLYYVHSENKIFNLGKAHNLSDIRYFSGISRYYGLQLSWKIKFLFQHYRGWQILWWSWYQRRSECSKERYCCNSDFLVLIYDNALNVKWPACCLICQGISHFYRMHQLILWLTQ